LKKIIKVCPTSKKEYETTETYMQRKFYGAQLINNAKMLPESDEQVVEYLAYHKVK
jgi:hypothetical protein